MRRLADGPAAELERNREAMARITDFAQTIDTSAVAMALARLQTPEFAMALETAARRAGEIMESFRTPEFQSAVERAIAAHQQTQQQMAEFAQRLALAHRATAEHFQTMAFQIDATIKALPTINFERLGGLVAIAQSRRATLAIATEKLVVRHTLLTESLTVAKNPAHALPAAVGTADADLFVHMGAVRSITPHEGLSERDDEASVSIRVEISTTTVDLEETCRHCMPLPEQYRAAKLRAVDASDWWTGARRCASC